MRFNKGKGRILHLGSNNPKYQHGLGCPTKEQLCREGPGSPGGSQGDNESAVSPCGQEAQWHPGLHWEELERVGRAGALGPVLGSLVPETQGAPAEGPVKGHKDDEGSGAS
ncbi:hypothetical protein TURU_020326 [Turdus rufiventris]|nr:hypothetical protein TURU_020326 [Turdus rufiventris]